MPDVSCHGIPCGEMTANRGARPLFGCGPFAYDSRQPFAGTRELATQRAIGAAVHQSEMGDTE